MLNWLHDLFWGDTPIPQRPGYRTILRAIADQHLDTAERLHSINTEIAACEQDVSSATATLAAARETERERIESAITDMRAQLEDMDARVSAIAPELHARQRTATERLKTLVGRRTIIKEQHRVEGKKIRQLDSHFSRGGTPYNLLHTRRDEADGEHSTE